MSTQLKHFPAVREALGFKDNKSVHAACLKWSIPVVALNKRVKALRTSDLELLLQRATVSEVA